MRSVLSRGSVGSMFRRRILIGEVDPTLSRDGTDVIPLQFAFSHNLGEWGELIKLVRYFAHRNPQAMTIKSIVADPGLEIGFAQDSIHCCVAPGARLFKRCAPVGPGGRHNSFH